MKPIYPSTLNWIRVSKSHPCPVCNHSDYCTIRADGTVAKCCRVHDGLTARKHGEDGAGLWTIHKLTEAVSVSGAPEHTYRISPSQAESLCRKWHADIADSRKAQLSQNLGVSCNSLRRLRLGWATASELELLNTKCRGAGAFTFPMRNGTGQIVGVRLRSTDGHKYAVKGSEQGIFIPAQFRGIAPVLIVEGPTDCAAALDLGFNAIGRPSNTSGHHLVAEWLTAKRVRWVTLIEDNDPEGSTAARCTEMGTSALNDSLKSKRIGLKVLRPTAFKDLREYLNSGGTRSQIDAMIQHAQWKGKSMATQQVA